MVARSPPRESEKGAKRDRAGIERSRWRYLVSEIIKERCGRYCILRADTYNSTFAHFKRLVDRAKCDFPDLIDSHVEIVHYGGPTSRDQFGIEFAAPGPIPESYVTIPERERTL